MNYFKPKSIDDIVRDIQNNAETIHDFFYQINYKQLILLAEHFTIFQLFEDETEQMLEYEELISKTEYSLKHGLYGIEMTTIDNFL